MKKTTHQKIDEAYEDLNDIALEIVDILEVSEDLGDNYVCFVDKELYDKFQKVNEKIVKLYDKQNEQDKLAIKR